MAEPDDVASLLERRLRRLRAELEQAEADRDQLSRRVALLQTEQTQLTALLATYRGEPPGPQAQTGQYPRARRATADDVADLLAATGKSLHYREIERELRAQGLDTGGGHDPANALLATYFNDPRLERTARGTYRRRASDNEPTGHDQLPATLMELLNSTRFLSLRSDADRYLAVLSYQYQRDPKGFERILDLGGNRRRYFARTREEIERSGRSTQPRQIPYTPFWAMCNASTEGKAKMLEEALARAGVSRDLARAAAEAVAIQE